MTSLANFRQHGISGKSLILNRVLNNGNNDNATVHFVGETCLLDTPPTVLRVIVNGESWGFITAWTLFSKQSRSAWQLNKDKNKRLFNWRIEKRWCTTTALIDPLVSPHASFQGYGDDLPEVQRFFQNKETRMDMLEQVIHGRLQLLVFAAATPLPPPVHKASLNSSKQPNQPLFVLATEEDVLEDRITFFLVRSMFHLLLVMDEKKDDEKEYQKRQQVFKTWCHWEKLLVQHRLRVCNGGALPDQLVEAWTHACFGFSSETKRISCNDLPKQAHQDAQEDMKQYSHWWQLADVLAHCPALLKAHRREHTLVAFMHRGTMYASVPWVAANIDVIAGAAIMDKMCASKAWLTQERIRDPQLQGLARYTLMCMQKAMQKLPQIGNLLNGSGGWVPSGFNASALPTGHMLRREPTFPDLSNCVTVPACINEIQSLSPTKTMDNTMRQVWARVMVDLGANHNVLLRYWDQRLQKKPDKTARMNGLKSVLQSASQNASTGLHVSCDKMIKAGYCPYARDPEIGATHARESCFIHAPLSIGGPPDKERTGVHFEIRTPASFVRRHIHVAYESSSSSSSSSATTTVIPFKPVLVPFKRRSPSSELN